MEQRDDRSEVADGVHLVLGAGPVGRAVAEHLAGLDAKVRVVTRSGGGPDGPGIERVAADLADPEQRERLASGVAVVYACAQPEYHRWPEEFPALQDAMLGLATAADAVYVAMENTYMYPPTAGPLIEDLPYTATTRKGHVRAVLAQQVLEAHEQGRVRTVSGRASDFFGPQVTGSSVGDRFFPPILAGKSVSVLGDPGALHTYTYVPDIARGLVRLGAEPAAWGRAWHLPSVPAVSTRAFAEAAYAAAGTIGRVKTVPVLALRALGLVVPPVREMIEMRYEFESDFVVDDSAYRTAFGDEPTPLADALAATVAWYRAHP